VSRFRFVHASDLHLDTPFKGIGHLDPDVAVQLRNASLEAWDGLVALALERQADFLLLAGDIYDGADRGVRAQLRFLRGIEQLAEHQVPVFVVYGNHDPLDGWSAIRQWPPNVTVFGSDQVGASAVERRGEQLAMVHGISYPRRDVADNLALRFGRGSESGFHIGLLHCNVGPRPEHLAYSPCTVDDLRGAQMDYWALGHIHKRETLNEGHPWIVYPGNLQGRSLKPSERGPKGAVVVDVDHDVVTNVAFVALDRVRSVVIEVDITSLEDIPTVSRALLDRLAAQRSQSEGRGLLVRGLLRGSGTPHEDLRRRGRLTEMLAALRDEVKGERPFVWWEGLANETRPDLDLEAITSRGDFSAEVLSVGKRLRADRVQLHDLMDRQFKALQRTGVRKWVGDPDEDEEARLLEGAEDLALELLEEEPVEG